MVLMVVNTMKCGPLQEKPGDDLDYKMVLVVATCKTDIANFSLANLCLHPEDAEHTANFCLHPEDAEHTANFCLHPEDAEHTANFILAPSCLLPGDVEHIANFSLVTFCLL